MAATTPGPKAVDPYVVRPLMVSPTTLKFLSMEREMSLNFYT
jgi:hypothetical protein